MEDRPPLDNAYISLHNPTTYKDGSEIKFYAHKSKLIIDKLLQHGHTKAGLETRHRQHEIKHLLGFMGDLV